MKLCNLQLHTQHVVIFFFRYFRIKKEILPVVQSLCQDVDYEVRGCMCRQLDCVARGLGSV